MLLDLPPILYQVLRESSGCSDLFGELVGPQNPIRLI
jgi:hypothetical protein